MEVTAITPTGGEYVTDSKLMRAFTFFRRPRGLPGSLMLAVFMHGVCQGQWTITPRLSVVKSTVTTSISMTMTRKVT